MSRLAAGLLLIALALVPQASGRGLDATPSAPAGLHAFTLRADDPVKPDHTYADVPAFAWQGVPGAKSYELELATSRSFSDVSIIYSDNALKAPVASVQKQLPWMTGDPYAFWVRVRA